MKILSLFVLIITLSFHVFADGKRDERLDKLIVRAKVLEAKMNFSDEKMPSCKLKIETTFTNEGDEPIIILKPIEERENFNKLVFLTGISIFGKNEYGNYKIQNGGALPSVCIGCNEDLAKLLDQKNPPDEYTKILKPNESFTLIDNAVFGMPLKFSSGMYGWDEIKNNNWKISGDIGYSLFPTNLGKYGEDFGHKLQKRWMNHGILYVGETHSLIGSERFEIDLSSVKF